MRNHVLHPLHPRTGPGSMGSSMSGDGGNSRAAAKKSSPASLTSAVVVACDKYQSH